MIYDNYIPDKREIKNLKQGDTFLYHNKPYMVVRNNNPFNQDVIPVINLLNGDITTLADNTIIEVKYFKIEEV